MGRRVGLITLLGIALAVVTHLSARQVHACTIGPGARPTPPEELAKADAAFVGTVIGINEPAFPSYENKTAVRIEVAEIWKGPNQHSIVVYANYSPEVAAEIATHPERHPFVGELAIGQAYLIFANRERTTGILVTDRRSCSYIQGGIIPYSLEDVADLGPPLLQGEQIGVGMPIAGGKPYELVLTFVGAAIVCAIGGLFLRFKNAHS